MDAARDAGADIDICLLGGVAPLDLEARGSNNQ